jgi:hypothetical protein
MFRNECHEYGEVVNQILTPMVEAQRKAWALEGKKEEQAAIEKAQAEQRNNKWVECQEKPTSIVRLSYTIAEEDEDEDVDQDWVLMRK